MNSISISEFKSLLENSKVLEQDAFGVKVVENQNQEIIKIFRLKRKLSSARLRPYAVRFARNAKRLKKLHIPTVEVSRIAYCPEAERHIVVYPKLTGELLRDVLQDPVRCQRIMQKAGSFMADLHNKGIYFRSVHFKNVLLLENGELGLIDISDMFFKTFKLRPGLCLRNFAHMLRYRQDRETLRPLLDDFLNSYLGDSKLPKRHHNSIVMGLEALASQN